MKQYFAPYIFVTLLVSLFGAHHANSCETDQEKEFQKLALSLCGHMVDDISHQKESTEGRKVVTQLLDHLKKNKQCISTLTKIPVDQNFLEKVKKVGGKKLYPTLLDQREAYYNIPYIRRPANLWLYEFDVEETIISDDDSSKKTDQECAQYVPIAVQSNGSWIHFFDMINCELFPMHQKKSERYHLPDSLWNRTFNDYFVRDRSGIKKTTAQYYTKDGTNIESGLHRCRDEWRRFEDKPAVIDLLRLIAHAGHTAKLERIFRHMPLRPDRLTFRFLDTFAELKKQVTDDYENDRYDDSWQKIMLLASVEQQMELAKQAWAYEQWLERERQRNQALYDDVMRAGCAPPPL